MKVVFLDIDGVLNNVLMWQYPNQVWRSQHTDLILDMNNMNALKELVNRVDCKIVLSSSHRTIGDKIKAIFKEADLPPIEDMTPVLDRNNRENEIRQYLIEHPEIDRYVIIDDIDVFPEDMQRHLVVTSSMFGLTMTEVKKACDILNNTENITFYNESDYETVCQIKLSNGQVIKCTFVFYETDVQRNAKHYYMKMFVNKKKNGYVNNEQTGTCGLEGLVKAKKVLERFIEDKMHWHDQLYIAGSDKRRYDIYKRYLMPIGFIPKEFRTTPYLIYTK